MIPKTFSQTKVSRDQILMHFCCKMWLCGNGSWNSPTFGITSGYILLDVEHSQVSFCHNSLLIPSFLVSFSCLIYVSPHHFVALYVRRPSVDLSNHCSTFCEHRGSQRGRFGPLRACFFDRQTWSASRLSWRSWTCSVSICDNSLRNFFISDIRCSAAGSNGSDADDDQARWWVSSRSDRGPGRVTFHCVLQQKLIWARSKPRFRSSHGQDL